MAELEGKRRYSGKFIHVWATKTSLDINTEKNYRLIHIEPIGKYDFEFEFAS